MEEIKRRFGAKLKALRTQQQISQEELSFRCGLSKNYISDVERGTRNVTIVSVTKLASGLKVPEKELFEFNGKED